MHIDLDYFYAQAEEIRSPELKNKPIAVCMFSGRSEFSGAIATSNYMARALGIKAGMPISIAKQKSKELVLLKADRQYYEQVSDRVMDIIRQKGEKFEQTSIDEAYLDISESVKGSFVDAEKLAKEIKKEVFEKELLTCSIGIGPNKLIAKMASETKKPNGLTVIIPSYVQEFLRTKSISDLQGVGPKTVEELEKQGIKTITQLAKTQLPKLVELFGEKKGKMLHEKANGIDDSIVEEKEQQQYSRIITLKENTSNPQKIFEYLPTISFELEKKCIELRKTFKTISITIISNKLESFTRSKTIEKASQKSEDIIKVSKNLIEEFFSEKPGFVARRFGIGISGLSAPEKQKSILDFK
jgi:DNA polymerase IV (DinB-like DNA polymerase)